MITLDGLQQKIQETIQRWTHSRVADLFVEIHGERIILRGCTSSFHVKQLAQQGVRELFPSRPLRNEIVVSHRFPQDLVLCS